MNDLKPEAHYPEQFHSFDFKQDSFNTIYFGKKLKGPQGNSNVLFDEIDALERILQIYGDKSFGKIQKISLL